VPWQRRLKHNSLFRHWLNANVWSLQSNAAIWSCSAPMPKRLNSLSPWKCSSRFICKPLNFARTLASRHRMRCIFHARSTIAVNPYGRTMAGWCRHRMGWCATCCSSVAHGGNKYQSRENRARVRELLMRVWNPMGAAQVLPQRWWPEGLNSRPIDHHPHTCRATSTTRSSLRF